MKACCATIYGIPFTFGGLRVDSDAQVLDHHAAKIVGLYAAGEMVGGIFYFNYPNGAGYARRDRAEDHRR